jgi:RNA polymerase sigma factor (sigma-70 family)
MARAAPSPILRLIRRVVEDPRVRELSDQELLLRCEGSQDKAAFHTLLCRHGPMVLDVCGAVLGNGDDAEDAFQATFLILVRKAGSIRKTASLGAWLHGVAYRTALKSRAQSATRLKHESRVPGRPASEPEDLTWREVRLAIHEELGRLPDRYRAPLVLCYLEGKTQDQAAAQLGLAKGTLKGRLERTRELLRGRLLRRGLGPAALLATAAWPAASAGTSLPPSMSSTAQIARLFAVGRAAPSPRVVALAEGVLKSMLFTKIASAVAGLLVVLAVLGVLGVAAGTYAPAPIVAVSVPQAKDTPSQGVSDGDQQRRREGTYSVRAIIRVMPPYNLKALNHDYQHVRVRQETKEFVELEVVVYPFHDSADAIKGNPHWKKDSGMKEYLDPGITTNWDDEMRRTLLYELAKDGVDPDKLTDKEVVEQVSRWLFKRSQHRNMFCTFYVGFPGGKPEVLPGLEKAFERDKGDPKWTVQQQFDHELFGKQMFANKTYGTCTSAAVYQTTVLRALGIPTRMILCIPLADGSDAGQVEMVDQGLTHHRVRCDACLGALSGGTGFASHTLCEVFVDGQWRRLNYSALGQSALQRNYLGLMIKVHTFKDLSEANLAATWGTRYAKSLRDDVFRHSNPYRLLEVSDHFGKNAKVPNPPAEQELKQVTIDKAYWPDAKDAPDEIRKIHRDMLADGNDPAAALIVQAMAGQRFYIHCREWLENAGDYLQYKLFMRRADTNFVLRAKGQPDVPCQISMNFYTHRSRNLCELEVAIAAAESAKMASGVAYSLHPQNGKKGYEWKVRDGLTLTR